jgi:hypothetical protein
MLPGLVAQLPLLPLLPGLVERLPLLALPLLLHLVVPSPLLLLLVE